MTDYTVDGQWSNVYAFISSPATVLACQVNDPSPANDRRTSIAFDGVTAGAYTAALDGMTVLVGSAAGLSDRGLGCIDGSATASSLPIIMTSNIAIADNDYVTVIQDFGVWARKKLPTYTNQLSVPRPTIAAGGDRVLKLTGANVATTYALTGAASYVTTCAGSTVTNGTTDHPTVAVTTAGEYLVKIVGTGANGAVSTTYRIVYVYSAANPPKNIILQSNSGDESGWSATIQLYENQSSVRDRAKCIIFGEDYFNGAQGSAGDLAGCENIILSGWIAGDTIDYDVDNGGVSFDVRGAGYWLDKMDNESEIVMMGTAAADWGHMASLTVDKMLWFMASWQTTCLNCMDAVYTGDTRTAPVITAPSGSIKSQIDYVTGRILANAFTDQYGRMIFRIDTPLIPIADRAGIASAATLTSADFESINIDKTILPPTSQTVITGQTAAGVYMAAIGGGRIAGRFGTQSGLDELLAADQAQLNVMAGSLFAKDNTPYKFSINNLRGNNRTIEPGKRITLTILAADNLGGVAYSGYAIVRSVDRSHDPVGGGWSISLDADAETQAGLYCTGDIPIDTDTGLPADTGVPFPNFPPFSWSNNPVPTPPPPPGTWGTCDDASPQTGPYLSAWDKTFVNGITGTTTARTWNKCTIRAATASYKSYMLFYISNTGLAYNHLTVYGIDATGARVVTGVVSTTDTYQPGYLMLMRADFSPASTTQVAGFELVCDEGLDVTAAAGPALTYGSVSWSPHFNYATGSVPVLTGSQFASNVVGLYATTYLNDPQSLFSSQHDLNINLTTTTVDAPLYFSARFEVLTANNCRSNFGFGWVDGSRTMPSTFYGYSGGIGVKNIGFSVDNDPASQTGIFQTRVWYYISTGLTTLGARQAGLQNTNLYNVCPVEVTA